MKHLSFRNYPTTLLIYMTLFFAIGIVAIKKLITTSSFDWELGIAIIATPSAISLIFKLININLMLNWYLKILGLTDIRGEYKGSLISSYHVDDDPEKDSITMKIEMEISQNINAIKIFGKIYPINDIDKTSEFVSEWAQLQQLENGKFVLEYRYSNKSNVHHKWHKKYTLTSHTGFASLTFDPKTKSLEGIYFTYENRSNGLLKLTHNGK